MSVTGTYHQRLARPALQSYSGLIEQRLLKSTVLCPLPVWLPVLPPGKYLNCSVRNMWRSLTGLQKPEMPPKPNHQDKEQMGVEGGIEVSVQDSPSF